MNALSVLKQDHGNVETLFKRFEAADEPDERREIVDHVIEQLSVHAAIEEQFFYPALRAEMPDAASDVLEALEEHHLVKLSLVELERLPASSERFEAKVTVLIENVRHHVTEEEDELFPKVREAIPAHRLDELGDALDRAKETAPVRPHPFQPDVPPLNLVLGLPVALLDKGVTAAKQAAGQVLHRVRSSA